MMSPANDSASEDGRASLSEVESAPQAVLADVDGVESARQLVEALEDRGIVSNAIALVEAETKDPRNDDTESDVAESDAFASLSKSVILGGFLGMAAGAVLGLAMSLLIPDLEWYWGMVMAGVFGAGIGGAAGGMSVAKYSSPAWNETYQIEDDSSLMVAVHHEDREVIQIAHQVMENMVGAESVRRHGSARDEQADS